MKTSDFDTIRKMAVLLGIKPSTLYDAVRRGELRTYGLASGTVLLRVSDVHRWLKTPRRRGRPPKS